MMNRTPYPRPPSPHPARMVRESADPERLPRVGDRVFWHGARPGFVGVFARREGTITAVYTDPERRWLRRGFQRPRR